jgi:hypothetical protein
MSESDGFKWRKYGQKNIKSASHPRSYYRCTRPDCPARKQVENGVAKYDNAHNHEKPTLLLAQQHKNKVSKNDGDDKVEKKKSAKGISIRLPMCHLSKKREIFSLISLIFFSALFFALSSEKNLVDFLTLEAHLNSLAHNRTRKQDVHRDLLR